jgi:hypothetical protein
MTAVLPVPEPLTQTQQKEYWTTSYFQDRFFLDLTKATNEIKIIRGNGLTEIVIHYRKYYRQAISKMYRIPLSEQHPTSKDEAVIFKILFSDLSARVQEEFLDYCKLYDKKRVTIFLKQIVIRLFENLDFDYAHSSVMKKLRVSVICEVNKIG